MDHRSGPRVVPTAGYGLSSRHVSPECTCAVSAGTGHGIPRPRPGELHVRQKRTTDYDKRSPKTFKATQGMHTCGPQSDRGRFRFEQYHSTRKTRRDAHTDDTTDDGQLQQLGRVHVNVGHDKKLLHKVMRNGAPSARWIASRPDGHVMLLRQATNCNWVVVGLY